MSPRQQTTPEGESQPLTGTADHPTVTAGSRSEAGVSDTDLEQRIRLRAYEIYCSRDGGDDNELEDWLTAEREIRFGHAATEGHGSALLEITSDAESADVQQTQIGDGR